MHYLKIRGEKKTKKMWIRAFCDVIEQCRGVFWKRGLLLAEFFFSISVLSAKKCTCDLQYMYCGGDLSNMIHNP